MTQEEQDAFLHSLESALSWMKVVQERLRVSDNTQGPRSALETRLRETEAIRESEHEGWVKVDVAVGVAEILLRSSDEETKSQTISRLKELKALWEETSTYITHCHSRIEWVWLHWEEYLRAQMEFEAWLRKMQQALGPQPELQLGAREKLWYLEHHQVLLGDAQAQEPLLERLLDEAADLHHRTQDPSVGPAAQASLQDTYTKIRDRAEERVLLLQKFAEEHRLFDCSVQKFWALLDSMSEELTRYSDIQTSLPSEDMAEDSVHSPDGKDSSQIVLHPLCKEGVAKKTLRPLQPNTPEKALPALQALCERVDGEEMTLRHLEGLAESVKVNTSPAGSEKVAQEVERLRVAWEGLRQRLRLEQERLRSMQLSQAEYRSHAEKLRAGASLLRLRLQELNQELECKGEKKVEEEVLWKKYMDVRRALVAEEPHVEQLKTQLTELLRLSPNTTPLTEQVLSVVKEYQGLKGRVFRLWMKSDTSLRQVLLDPLQDFSRWRLLVSQILEASEEVSDCSSVPQLMHNVEKLLKDSLQLQERLCQLQMKGDLLSSVFDPEKAESLGLELKAAVREREKRHSQLCQRNSHLQGLLLRMKDFEDSYECILNQLDLIRERFIIADKLQPDILAKTVLLDQLMAILKDLEEYEAHLIALQTMVSSNPADRHKVNQLCTEWKNLCKTVRKRVGESKRSVADHKEFLEVLLGLEKWLLEMRKTVESFCNARGEWSLEKGPVKAERVLGEFPERELELDRVEALGQGVLAQTSEGGKRLILQDLQHLRDSWSSLHMLSLNLYRLLNGDRVAGSDFHVTGNDINGESDGQIETDKGASLGETVDICRMSGSEHGSDYSGGTGGEQRLGTRGDGSYVDQGYGGEDEGVGLEQGSTAEGGLSAGIKGTCVGQGVRVESGLGSGSERTSGQLRTSFGSLSTEDEDICLGQDITGDDDGVSVGQGFITEGDKGAEQSTGWRPDVGDKHTSLTQAEAELGAGVESQETGTEEVRLGIGDPGMELEQAVRAEVRLGVGGPSIGLGQVVRPKEGMGVGGPGMDLGQQVRPEVKIDSGRSCKPSSGLVQGRSLSFTEPCTEQSLGGEEADDSQFKTRTEEVDLGGEHSQSSTKDKREITTQQNEGQGLKGTETSQRVKFGNKTGTMTEDEPSGLSGPSVEGSVQHTQVGCVETQLQGDRAALQEFEAWLRAENTKLCRILRQKKTVSREELRLRQQVLKELRSRVAWGQSRLQELLMSRGESEEHDPALEEIRYRWMLYKSKLQGVGDLRALLTDKDVQDLQNEPLRSDEKRPGLLQRACCVALPLQLFLLSLLLLLFLLPLTDEGASCSLANNFARSFRLMLHYRNPPPT